MEIYNDSVKALEFPKKEEKKIGKSSPLSVDLTSLCIDFNLEDDDVQDEAELVESLLEEFDDM